MVDSVARINAAEALKDFRDGQITNFDFEGRWPCYDDRDRGLHAIETMIWRSYDDFRGHTLTGEHGLSDESRLVFDRCVLLLLSECEYAWPDDDFMQAGASSGGLTTLGLSDTYDPRLRELHVEGDDPFWPFSNLSEYESAKSR